jgi:L-amino acid N-acyltransferase YncA
MILAEIEIADARPQDLPAIIAIYAEGQVSGTREAFTSESAADYRAAFDELAADPRADLLVLREGDDVLGFALFFSLRGFAGRGARRAMLHSLFMAERARGRGLGRRLLAEVERRASARGACRIDLTSDKRRLDAHRFYRMLGYAQSHEGFSKDLALSAPGP